MITAEVTQVVGELKHVLIENIIDRERFVTGGGVGDAAFGDINRRKVFAERRPRVTEAVVAGEEPICDACAPAVVLECV